MHFGNLLTAMITPFNNNGEIDFKEVRRIANKLANEGSDGLVVTGTTGESPTLSHEEDCLLYSTVLDEVGDRVKVIAGTGSNCTKTTIQYTKIAESIGIHGAMIVVPYYNKPSQQGMIEHFVKVGKNTNLPLMIYNIPGRTGVNMLPETVKEIFSKSSNYCSIKEASGDLNQMEQIIKLMKTEKFSLYSGDDRLTLDILKIGGTGVVSVASHVAGNQIKSMINNYQNRDVKTAESINKKLKELFKVLFITSNPAPTKAALRLLDYKVGMPRLPIVDVNNEEFNEIKKVLKNLELVK